METVAYTNIAFNISVSGGYHRLLILRFRISQGCPPPHRSRLTRLSRRSPNALIAVHSVSVAIHKSVVLSKAFHSKTLLYSYPRQSSMELLRSLEVLHIISVVFVYRDRVTTLSVLSGDAKTRVGPVARCSWYILGGFHY